MSDEFGLLESGEINISLKNPLSSETIFVKDIEQYIKDQNNILIYLDDEPIPYCMKRSYFINLLIEDYDYECVNDDTTTQYYNLSKLFLNHEEQPKIIINIKDLKSFFNGEFSYFKLTNTSTKIKTNTIIDIKQKAYEQPKEDEQPKEYEDEEYEDYEDEDDEEEKQWKALEKKWKALKVYCHSGYTEINNYLVRLTEIPKYSLFEVWAKFWAKISGNKIITEPMKENKKIQTIVDHIDYLFYTKSETQDEELILYRDMITFYTYLKKPGDKMVVENYMSCFDKDGEFGGLANRDYLDIHCIITVEPGIPFIKTYENEEFIQFLSFPEEREVILPRNLLATYNGDDDDGNKRIHISKLYPNQFLKELKCNEMTLYTIEKSVNHSFVWEVAGGSNKKNKKSYKFSIRKRSNMKNKTNKKHSYKN
jgi:hypothetical protein